MFCIRLFKFFSYLYFDQLHEDKGTLTKKVREKKTKVKTTSAPPSFLGPSWILYDVDHIIVRFMALDDQCSSGSYQKKDGTFGFCGSRSLKGTQSKPKDIAPRTSTYWIYLIYIPQRC